MRKKLLLLSCALRLNVAWAATPTLAVPDLVYLDGVDNYGVTNADVKHELVKSGKFKLMHTPKSYNAANVIAELNNEQRLIESEGSGVKLAKPVVAKNKYTPDYILVGEVVSSDISNNGYKIKNTTTQTETKTLSVAVQYNLIDIADNTVTASFMVNANGSQTTILDSSTSQVIVNKSKLVKEAAQDLANQVVSELTHNAKISADIDAPIVKNFSTKD